MTTIEYLHPGTAPAPGPLARIILAPWPWWFWTGVVALTMAPLIQWIGWPLTPMTLYAWPVFGLIFAVYSAFPLLAVRAARAVARMWLLKRHRLRPSQLRSDARVIAAVLATVVIYWLVVATPIGVLAGAAARRPALESIRERVSANAMPAGPVMTMPFRFTDTEAYDGVVVVLYTEGARGDFPGGGAEFLYVPAGVEFPPYNTGADGHLFGQWYWFVTD